VTVLTLVINVNLLYVIAVIHPTLNMYSRFLLLLQVSFFGCNQYIFLEVLPSLDGSAEDVKEGLRCLKVQDLLMANW